MWACSARVEVADGAVASVSKRIIGEEAKQHFLTLAARAVSDLVHNLEIEVRWSGERDSTALNVYLTDNYLSCNVSREESLERLMLWAADALAAERARQK